nr:hypothetical protein Iba_chr04aCG8510 [Ipomoea batatas]GMC84150.1 hypothetical protein Iba_chr04cCG8850 [Ipomoea batatas]
MFQRPAFSDLTFPSLCYDFSFLTALKFGRSSVQHSLGFIKDLQSAIQFLDYLAGLPWSFGAWQSRRLLVYSHVKLLSVGLQSREIAYCIFLAGTEPLSISWS